MKYKFAISKAQVILSGLMLLGIIFVAAAIFSPWWTIRLSPEAEMLKQSSMVIDYNLFSGVTATQTIGNVTRNANVTIAAMTGNQSLADQVAYTFGTTFSITTVGLILTIIVVVLVAIVPLRISAKFETIIYLLGIVATLLLLVAPMYVSYNMKLSSASTVSPIPIPAEWIELKPAHVNSFWGAELVPKTSAYPIWARDQRFWMWGASTGWYLTLAGAFLVGLCSLVTEARRSAKKHLEEQRFK